MKFCRFKRDNGEVAVSLACQDDRGIADLARIHDMLSSGKSNW